MREKYFNKYGDTTMTSTEAERILAGARAEHDKLTLRQFEHLGDSDHKRTINYARQDQYYNVCGYKGRLVFDEYGWVKNNVPEESIEKIVLWKRDNGMEDYVEVAQLPSGKWITGYFYMMSESGGACACHIYRPQFDTRNKALEDVLKRIQEQIGRGTAKDKKHLQDIQAARLNLRQLSLF